MLINSYRLQSCVEKIFIIIINKYASVKPYSPIKKLSTETKIFQKKLSTICGIKESFPQQNVDFVDNLLITCFCSFLSTFFIFFVENIVHNEVNNLHKSSIQAIYNGRLFKVENMLFFHNEIFYYSFYKNCKKLSTICIVDCWFDI